MSVELNLDPVLWRIGQLQIGWHGVFTALAIGVAVWYGVRRIVKLGISENYAIDVAIGGVVGGIVGARLLHVADHAGYYIDDPLAAMGYAFIRFGLGFFRQETVIVWGLQQAQLVGLGTGLAVLGILTARLWLGRPEA